MKRKTGVVLPKRFEELLRAVHLYRYVTSLDIAYLLYTPGALTRAREHLSELSGGADYVTNRYLYRFPLPGIGNAVRVYTLGSKGRDYLAELIGMPCDWYFRPAKVKHFTHAHVVHSLVLTRFLAAADFFARQSQEFRLSGLRTCYEIGRSPSVVRIRPPGRGELSVKVIPDAWLLFERRDGKRAAILVEIDRGREHQVRFVEHVRSRIEFVSSGEYRRFFGTTGLTIAYATTGERKEYRETRLEAMRRWTRELMANDRREEWASVFRFCTLEFDEMYEAGLFDRPVWFRPDRKAPMPLLSG